MQERTLRIGSVDYSSNKTPDDYKCDKCGKAGIKIWREYQTMASVTKLLCTECAFEDQKDSIKSLNGMVWPASDSIGWLIPAVPVEGDDTFWGYTSSPQKGYNWWKNLPE